jgi:GAF domain-containing protein
MTETPNRAGTALTARGHAPADSTTASQLAEALADAAEKMNAPRLLDERLDAVMQTAVDTVPGFDHVSVSLSNSKRSETRAASSAKVHELDLIQYDAQEGPCVDAFTHRDLVTVHHLRHEQRWPAYIPKAAEAGIMSQMAVPLTCVGPVRGSLNLYSTTREDIDPEAPGVALLFATHVTLALGWARTEAQLNEALSTRKLIGQALGIVMERYQIGDTRAFEFLVRVASTRDKKLKDVAHELVTQTDSRYTIENRHER